MIDWSTCPAVERDPERVSGAWTFKGTRIPVAVLFDNLDAGATIEDIIEWFPGLTEAHVHQVFAHVASSLETV